VWVVISLAKIVLFAVALSVRALGDLVAASIRLLIALVVAAAGCANQPFYLVGHPAAAPHKSCPRPWRMGKALGAADGGEGHDGEPDFDLGYVDGMREALGGGGDGGMLGTDADLRLIPDDDADFPELAALRLSEPPVAAAFDNVGSAAQEVRRVCEYASVRWWWGGRAQCALYMLMLLPPPTFP